MIAAGAGVSLIARTLARVWEPLLIAALIFGGWQLLQRLDDKTAALEDTQEALAETREELVTVTLEKRRVSEALATRERTLHALQTRTESARSVLRAAPDDGCLDRSMPADVLRLFHPPDPHRVGSLMQPQLAAAPSASTAVVGADVATPGGPRLDAGADARDERGR